MKKIFISVLFLFGVFAAFAQINKDFYYYCYINDKANVQAILENQKIDINYSLSDSEKTDLFSYIAEKENIEFSKDELNDLNKYNLCPLTLSILRIDNFTEESLETFSFLVSTGAEINIKFYEDDYLYSVFCFCFENNSSELLKYSTYLLQNGLKLNFANGEGVTPLISAIFANSAETTELFIKNGADVNFKSISGYGITPLIAAIRMRNTGIINLLLKYKAKKDVADNDNTTVFMHACATGSLEIAKMFFSSAELEKRDKDGYTPLMYATISGDISVVDYLLQNGADINAKDNEDKPVLGHTDASNFELKKYLISKGAKVTEEYVLGYFKACPEETEVCNLLLPYINVSKLDYRKSRMDEYEKGTPVEVTFRCSDIDKKKDTYKVTGYISDGSNQRRIFITFYSRPQFLEDDTVTAVVLYDELTVYLESEIPSFTFVSLKE